MCFFFKPIFAGGILDQSRKKKTQKSSVNFFLDHPLQDAKNQDDEFS